MTNVSVSPSNVAVVESIARYSGTSSTPAESFFPFQTSDAADARILPGPLPLTQTGLPASQWSWLLVRRSLMLVFLSMIASLLLMAIGVPVGWLLGAMLVGVLAVLKQGKTQLLFPGAAEIGQVIIALATADRFSLDTLVLARSYAVPLMLCILVTGSLSLLNGYLLSRWAGIDRTTSLLGCTPGAGPSIVALSEEMGADTLIVAVLQYVRILLVSAIIPVLAHLFFVAPATTVTQASLSAVQSSSLPAIVNLLVLAVCGYLGIWLGRAMRLPSGGFLGPFLAGIAAFWAFPQQLYMPQPVFIAGLMLVGLTIGLKFDWQAVRRLFKAVLLEVFLVLGLILSCLVVAYGFHLVTHVDALTATLGSTPGGISTMIASAVEMGSDSGLVMAMQMTRMVMVLLLTPWLATNWIKPDING